jgi:hypothetical protein
VEKFMSIAPSRFFPLRKSTYHKISCFFAIFGFLQFIILTFFAALFYPGGYDYFGYFFSDLGAVRARNGEINQTSSLMFSGSFFLLMIFLIPFWIAILEIFKNSIIERNLSKTGSLIGVLSFFGGLGVIIYPMDTHFDEHQFFAGFFFTLLAGAVLFYSLAIFFHQNYSNVYALLSLCLFILVGLFEMVAFGNYQPLVQKIVFFMLFIWIIMQVIHLWPFASP